MMHSQYTTITHLYQLAVNFTGGRALCIKITTQTSFQDQVSNVDAVP
jgi:hypothetical protein